MSAKLILQTFCFLCEKETKICTFIKVYKFTNYYHYMSVKRSSFSSGRESTDEMEIYSVQ